MIGLYCCTVARPEDVTLEKAWFRQTDASDQRRYMGRKSPMIYCAEVPWKK